VGNQRSIGLRVIIICKGVGILVAGSKITVKDLGLVGWDNSSKKQLRIWLGWIFKTVCYSTKKIICREWTNQRKKNCSL